MVERKKPLDGGEGAGGGVGEEDEGGGVVVEEEWEEEETNEEVSKEEDDEEEEVEVGVGVDVNEEGASLVVVLELTVLVYDMIVTVKLVRRPVHTPSFGRRAQRWRCIRRRLC